jgi:hypothetical protein
MAALFGNPDGGVDFMGPGFGFRALAEDAFREKKGFSHIGQHIKNMGIGLGYNGVQFFCNRVHGQTPRKKSKKNSAAFF